MKDRKRRILAEAEAAFWDQVDASTQYLNKYGRGMRASLGDALVASSASVGGIASAVGAPWVEVGGGAFSGGSLWE